MNLLNPVKDALSTGRRLLMPSCREALRLQSEALEQPLPPTRRPGLWLHLFLCKWCRFYGQQIRFLRHAAHAHADELTQATPQKLSPEARERIRQKLRARPE